MALQGLLRWFIPREDHFFGFLERQATVAHEAAVAVARLKDGASVDEVNKAVQELEHKGDAISHELEDALARTYVTPIDREDLSRLSYELDDVLDYMNGATRACALLGVSHPTKPMMDLMDKLVACTDALAQAVPNLRARKYGALIEASRKMRRQETEADVIFRDAWSALFRDDAIDAKQLLREREVLEGLENAIDHCEHVASTLANLAVKHG